MTDDNLTATECKQKGNEYFGASEFVQAVKWHSLAIEKLEAKPADDEERVAQLHLCFSNRAIANRESGQYETSLKDTDMPKNPSTRGWTWMWIFVDSIHVHPSTKKFSWNPWMDGYTAKMISPCVEMEKPGPHMKKPSRRDAKFWKFSSIHVHPRKNPVHPRRPAIHVHPRRKSVHGFPSMDGGWMLRHVWELVHEKREIFGRPGTPGIPGRPRPTSSCGCPGGGGAENFLASLTLGRKIFRTALSQ